MSRSTETVRLTLKAYDRDHPDRAIFPTSVPPLDDDAKAQIYRRFRMGVSAEVLAAPVRPDPLEHLPGHQRDAGPPDPRDQARVHRPRRASTTRERRAEILGADARAGRRQGPPAAQGPQGPAALPGQPLRGPAPGPRAGDAPVPQDELPEVPGPRSSAIELDPSRAKTADLDEIERLQEEALAVKNQIIRANLRLVVSIAKRHVGPSNNFFELVSDGNMSLIRAVEKFDFARGNKFSTYASWAIMKNFARTIPEENYRRDRFVTGHEEMFEAAADNRTDEHEYESALKRMQEAVKGMLGRLDDRERQIIISRFGLGGASEQTLEQLGRELGITKERVRQIESRAQDKLRKIASEEKLDLPML